MADVIDLASENIEYEITRRVKEIRQNSANDNQGSKFCIECDEEIPTARQKLGFKLCVPCAEEKERRESLYASY